MIGVRKHKGWGAFYYGGIILTKIFNLLIGSNFKDNATCYKLFPQHFKKSLLKYPQNDFVFDNVCLTYELFKSGLRIKEVEISYNPRNIGKKIKIEDGFLILREILSIFLSIDRGKNMIKLTSICLIILIYSFFAIQNINSYFIHISEDNNGLYGLAAINWLERGIFNLKFGIYNNL